MERVAHVRRRADLALVDAAVLGLGRVDLQHPVLVSVQTVRMDGLIAVVGLVNGAVALIGRVRVSSHRQQVDVSVAHPRHLNTSQPTETNRNQEAKDRREDDQRFNYDPSVLHIPIVKYHRFYSGIGARVFIRVEIDTRVHL